MTQKTGTMRFCKECGSDAVAPPNLTDEQWVAFFDGGAIWPNGQDRGECECGHVGPVGVDILDLSVPYYKVVR